MQITVIAHNIRSTHNIGSIFRTCDGFGVEHLYLSGYSPYPQLNRGDDRLPHIARKLSAQISKTALGAEATVPFSYHPDPVNLIESLKKDGYAIYALEQHDSSIPISQAPADERVALLLGEEVHGIPADIHTLADTTVEIPMYGKKESFNVSVAAGIALYALKERNNMI